MPYPNHTQPSNTDNDLLNNNNNTKKGLDIKQGYGMLDSGTTDHFMTLNARVTNIRPATSKLNIIIPDGSTISSSHECDINWPNLPPEAKSAHIIPQLHNQSLLSVVKLCAAGCTVIFKHDSCVVLYNGRIAMYGKQCPKTKLWLVPLDME